MTPKGPARTGRRRTFAAAVSALPLSLAMLAAPAAERVNVAGAHVQASCAQPSPYSLECDYRLPGTAEVLGVEAALGGLSLEAPVLEPLSATSATTAVLMLVDTSDPRRAPAVAAAALHVRALIAAGGPGYRFALAGFDSDLRMLAPLGSESDVVLGAADRIQAVGQTTELYRNATAAVHLLADYPADRRALVLFSDGMAEDSAYFHADVVDAANDGGVAIYGLGYPQSVALSVELQSLRRLAEETGGRFVAASTSFELPADFLGDPYPLLDSGGRLRLDLGAARGQAPGGAASVVLDWSTSAGETVLTVPVVMPPLPPEPVVKVVEIEVPKLVEVPTVIEVPAPASSDARPPAAPVVAAPPAATRAAGVAPPHTWQWYAMLTLGLLIVLLLLLIIVRLSRRPAPPAPFEAPESDDDEAPGGSARRTIAVLAPEEDDEEHAITKAAYRIGRQADNDLALSDPSISRHHAEIHRARDGAFSVVDLESMNGVFVNGKKARSAPLRDGDRLELGDVALHFSLRSVEEIPGEEIPGEQTVILRTVVPDIPFDGDNDMEDPPPIRRLL